jgi:nitrile hydratase accessory protein
LTRPDPVAAPLDAEGLAALPAIPRDADGPVFRAPWEAQAFAMAVRLHAAGCFTWREWADRLAAAIGAAQERGDPDLGTTYYLHWLAALEGLVADKGIATPDDLARRQAEWAAAASQTPRGHPITLAAASEAAEAPPVPPTPP